MSRQTQRLDPYIFNVNCDIEPNNFFPAGYEYFPRTVRFYEIQLITGGVIEKTGGGKLIIEGQHYEARKGDLFFRKPGMKVQGIAGFYSYNVAFDPVYSESRKHCYHSNIPFWASDEQTQLPEGNFFDHLPYKYNTAKFQEFELLFSELLQSFLKDPQANQPGMKSLLLQILNLVNDELDNSFIPSEKRITDHYYERVMNSKRFIDTNLGNKLTLENLALQFGTNPNLFMKAFKKVMGLTPFEYIIESRLTKARELLTTTTSLSIEEVASACGFEDISYFYRLFKQRFEITPALLSEGYRNRAPIHEAQESTEGIVESLPPIMEAPLKEASPPKEESPPKEGSPPMEGATQLDDAPPLEGKDISVKKPALLSIAPYIIGCTYNNQPDYVFPVGVKMVPRVVRYYEIELILGGAGKEVTEGQHFNASRGDIFFRRPGIVNQGISGYYFCEIAFDPVFSEFHRGYYESTTPFYLPEPETILPDKGFFAHFPYKYHTARMAELEPLFTLICRTYLGQKENWRPEANANLVKILTIVTEELSVHPTIIFEKQAVDNNYDRVMACKSLIDNHPERKFSLEMLAGMCGVSRNFFSKIFKQVIGTAPFEYISAARLNLAKTLLATSHLSIEEISARCGFDYTAYFYRLFKRHFKMTPNTFRQKSNPMHADFTHPAMK
jgi:transcriptional regulator GlxA family with amidase domain